MGQAQGPPERATTLRGIQAPHTGMQPRSPPGEAVPRVRSQNSCNGNDAKQNDGRSPVPATDTGTNRALALHSTDRFRDRKVGMGGMRRQEEPFFVSMTAEATRARLYCPSLTLESSHDHRALNEHWRADGSSERSVEGGGHRRRGVTSNVDPPTGQPRCEPRVLPLLADGQ